MVSRFLLYILIVAEIWILEKSSPFQPIVDVSLWSTQLHISTYLSCMSFCSTCKMYAFCKVQLFVFLWNSVGSKKVVNSIVNHPRKAFTEKSVSLSFSCKDVDDSNCIPLGLSCIAKQLLKIHSSCKLISIAPFRYSTKRPGFCRNSRSLLDSSNY